MVRTKKLSIKKHKCTSSWTRGLKSEGKKRKIIKVWIISTIITRDRKKRSRICLYFWAYIWKKKSAIASGAPPIGSAVAHPIERSRQNKGEKWKPMIKNQLVESVLGAISYISSAMNFAYIVDKINIDYLHREIFMRVAKDNSNILYIETVKQSCKIWFSSCVITMKLEYRGWNISWR
jgi:hypothetical protein